MDDREHEELRRLLASPRVGDRLGVMDRVSVKTGRRVVPLLEDPRVVALLFVGLNDPHRRIQRAAARGLRPWLARDPAILDSALTVYATDRFDGSYSHAALYDIRRDTVWVPKFAALKGHAALLRDGNTDRYFKFDFYVPGQAPQWIPHPEGTGHLVLHVIPEWSYSRQQLLPEFDERRRVANLAEQERYAGTAVEFYADAGLPYDVRVHRIVGGGGHHRERQLDVTKIPSVTAR